MYIIFYSFTIKWSLTYYHNKQYIYHRLHHIKFCIFSDIDCSRTMENPWQLLGTNFNSMPWRYSWSWGLWQACSVSQETCWILYCKTKDILMMMSMIVMMMIMIRTMMIIIVMIMMWFWDLYYLHVSNYSNPSIYHPIYLSISICIEWLFRVPL